MTAGRLPQTGRVVMDLAAGMVWTLQPGIDPEYLGFLPTFLNVHDQRSAQEQIATHHYATWHLGGDDPYELAIPHGIDDRLELHYPGDPPNPECARTLLRQELIVLFELEICAIVQIPQTATDGFSFVWARMD